MLNSVRPDTGARLDDWALVVLPLVHRDPAVWGENAEEFDPDRFSPERSRGRAAHVYKPFGTGERSCIGRQFALHEAILVMARILHRYEPEPDLDYQLKITERLTVMPIGFELRLRDRQPEHQASVIRPDSSIGQPGLNATSQGCPSGSAK